MYGDGEQSRDFTFVANAVQANILACEAKGAEGLAYNIGTGNRYTLNKTLELLAGISKRPLKAIYGPPRTGDIKDSQADISLAKQKRGLGYSPSVQFEEGLKRTWEWYSANHTVASRS